VRPTQRGMDLTLVILAAGLSSRYGGALKQVDGVGPTGEFLLDYAIYDAVRAGFTHVVFVARPDIEAALRARIAGFRPGVVGDVVFQRLEDLPPGGAPPPDRVKPWGTGQAVLAATAVLRAPFAVVNADDFYGAHAYRAMADHLRRARWTAPHPAAMIGYRLGDTLSANAGVSRAICHPGADGLVARVVETHDIVERDGRLRGRTAEGEMDDLDPDALVSMNFWGFQPPILGLLRERFARFLAASAADLSAEFLISTAVDELVASHDLALRALPTDGRWCGMTSRADRDLVAARLAEHVARGEYPSSLFGA
jgi:hypothetical protein